MKLKLIRSYITALWIILTRYRTNPREYFDRFVLKYDTEFQRALAKVSHGSGLTKEEYYTIYSSIKATADLRGDIAEVGVYRGGTAKLICEIKGVKGLYLFDTFEGMPNHLINEEIDRWQKGTHTNVALDLVKDYLKQYENVCFLKGVFPDTAYQNTTTFLKNKRFCFVHLDVDLYQSTLEALRFFWPRMVEGGRIVSHNYNLTLIPGGNTPGVKAAFLEFFKGKEERIIEIAETQCMVIK